MGFGTYFGTQLGFGTQACLLVCKPSMYLKNRYINKCTSLLSLFISVEENDDDREQMCVVLPPPALVSIEDILARAGMTFAIDQSLTMRQCDPVSTPCDYQD